MSVSLKYQFKFRPVIGKVAGQGTMNFETTDACVMFILPVTTSRLLKLLVNAVNLGKTC